MMHRSMCTLAAVAGLGATFGCGGAPREPVAPVASEVVADAAPAPRAEPDPAASRIVARNFDVAPGKFAELNLELDDSVEVNAAFRADGEVAWNVHSHPVGGTAVHQEGAGSEGKISFVAPRGQGYSLLWTNRGARPVNLLVSVELPPGARIVSWVPEVE